MKILSYFFNLQNTRLGGKIIILFLGVLFLGITAFAYENKVFYIHFVDEEDNLVLGKYLREGEKLYSDLFSHHQPLAYIFSAGIQEVTDPNSLYLLTKRHREFIILYSIIWSGFFIYKFGFPLLLFTIIYELNKFYIFGNLFLSESLAVYPIIYIVSMVLIKEKDYSRKEMVFLGFCFSLAALLLAPLWPLLFVLLISVIYKIGKPFPRNLLTFFWGSLPLIILSIYFSSITKYFYNVFYINFKYYISITNNGTPLVSIIKSYLTPLISFLPGAEITPLLSITQILSVIFMLYIAISIKMKKYRTSCFIVFLLGLANFRYIQPGKQFYEGFHLLPWFSLLILVISILFWKIMKNNKEGAIRISSAILITIAILASIYYSQNNLFEKRDMLNDQYINYSRQFDFGNAIKIMKADSHRLFVVPDEWLIYWQADIKHASYMVNYYMWMSSVPEIKNSIDDMFLNNPPEFFYCEPCNESSLQEYSKYQFIKKDGKSTKLLVLKDVVEGLSKKQIEELKFFNISLN